MEAYRKICGGMPWVVIFVLLNCGGDQGEIEEQPAPTKPVRLNVDRSKEPTKASESIYSSYPDRATTSWNLKKPDIAWHAVNSFGWDCDEVVERSEQDGEFYYVTCASGIRLRVYPRRGTWPSITNEQGGWEGPLPGASEERPL